VEAYRGRIIMPNRHEETHGNMYNGHLLASETYVGGHVEALEAGVFRSDVPTEFKIVPSAVQQASSILFLGAPLDDGFSAP
jgi:DNA polymerase epsilon subunit 1